MEANVKALIIRTGNLLGLVLFVVLSLPLNAQIPHGTGRPLPEGKEVESGLRAAVDYFTEMPSLDTDSARMVDDLPGNRIGGLKFAHTFYTNFTPENSGIVFHSQDGTKIWKIGIRSNGAFSLNILFSEFSIPPGAKVFLYNPDRSDVLGPFTSENKPHGGEFSVSPVEGDELIVEYQEPANALFTGKLSIERVNHDYRGYFRSSPRFHSISMPCIPDVSCNKQLDSLSKSTCLLIINGVTFCTGTLVNNTALNGKPYVLTASHCLSNTADYAGRVIAYMNYASPRCDTRIRGSEEFSLSGAICRALNSQVDFALIELSETPPADFRPTLAGWTLEATASQNAPFVCLHHPSGEPQKYCVEEDSLQPASWPYFSTEIKPDNHWYVPFWEKGHTWGGSSGSGLFDKNHRLTGALTGGESGDSTGCATSYPRGDYFFRFDKAWEPSEEIDKQLKYWLDPLAGSDKTSSVLTLDALDPYFSLPSKRITNLQSSESTDKYFFTGTQHWGYLFGHNSMRITSFAEHFQQTDSCLLLGAYLIAGKGTNTTDKPIEVTVYSGGEKPGDMLEKKVLNPSYTDFSNLRFVTKSKAYFTNKENYLRFDKPVRVGKDFFVGYNIEYPITLPEDTFCLYATTRFNGVNTAYFKQNNQWIAYTNHSFQPVSASLWIDPVVTRDTLPHETDSIYFGNDAKPIVAWSGLNKRLSFAFPENWSGETRVRIYDLTGRMIASAVMYPPLDQMILSAGKPGMIFIHFEDGQNACTIKCMTGDE